MHNLHGYTTVPDFPWFNGVQNPPGQVTQPDNPSHFRVTFFRWWPLAVLAVTLLLRVLLPAAAIETVYSRGIFVVLRSVWDYTLPLLPIPLFYVFWLAVIAWLFYTVRQYSRGRRSGVELKKRWGRAGRRTLNSIALLVTVFLLGWGFNYGRTEVNEYLGFAVYQPSPDELRTRVRALATELSVLRQRVSTDSAALTVAAFPDDLEAAVRPLLVAALLKHGYPAPGRPRLRQLVPKGILLHWSTAGVYWPWAGEGNIDAGLHPLQKPAVAAHELGHAYGFGDEGTCTFWAWLAGNEATDPALQYAFGLAYWRRIAGKLRQLDPEEYTAWRQTELDPGIRNDLQAIYDNGELYKDIAPVIRDATYDAYLKAQGIHEGLVNYGKVVRLVEGYRLNTFD